MTLPVVCVSVAEAVKDMLAAAELSQDLRPERSYADWEVELEDLETLHCDVVAVTTEQKVEPASRGRHKFIVPISVVIRKRFGQAHQATETGRIAVDEVDALMLLVQEISLLFVQERLTNFTAGIWQETKIVVAPHVPHIRKRQFTGIVQITFRADKTIE